MTKNNQVTVSSLKPKSVFTYGGIEWIVLNNKGKNGVLCLAEKSLFTDAFDDTINNDWKTSTLRKYLNNDLLEEMVLNGASETDFMPMTTNLITDDGLKDYGTCVDTISLISCQQYRRYRGIIPCLDNWWWTCTAYSTKANGYSHTARVIDSDGTMDGNYVNDGSMGVRPLCTLQSETLVEGNLI